MSSDFQQLAAQLLAQARELLTQWLPAGRWEGSEYVLGNLAGEPGKSLKINAKTGKWSDFATDEKGGDLISLYAAMEGINQTEAAQALSSLTTSNGSHSRHRSSAPRPSQPPTPTQSLTMQLPPSNAPEAPMVRPHYRHPRLGAPSDHWAYRTSDGRLMGYIVRFDPPFTDQQPKTAKQYVPQTWRDGQWAMRNWPQPRPLYGLDRLARNREAPVIIVEGEKAADAAQQLVGDEYVVVTWPGGCQALGAIDFKPLHGRRLVLWPDADKKPYPSSHPQAGQVMPYHEQPGPKAMRKLAAMLAPHCPRLELLDVSSQPDGWDAADALLAGLEAQALLTWMKAQARPYEPAENEDTWPHLHSLSEPIDAAFPVEILPAVLRHWVEAEAEATQTPLELPGLLALAVFASAAARRVVVEPWAGWQEPVNLFVAALLEPGNRKSAVFNDATQPLRELEAQLVEQERPKVEQALAQRRMDDARLRQLEKRAGEKGDENSRNEALELAARLASEPVPSLPRFIADNVTPEKLETMLAEQEGRLASMSAEGGVFDIMAGQYSKGTPSFDVYLKAHAGDDLRTDRIGREGVHVEKPALTCAYAIQPAVIAGLAGKPAFRGRGLLARFLYAIPQSPVGRRKVRPAPMPECVKRGYAQAVQQAATLQHERVLRLTPGAEAAFISWMREIESMLDIGGELAHMQDWGAKLGGLTLRLAANMHMIERPDAAEINAANMQAAITLARWAVPHADAALNLMHMSNPAHEGATHVWAWIRRRKKDSFTARDAWQATRRHFDRREHLDNALEVLTERGYIRPMEPTQSGPGRKTQPFEVRPSLRSKASINRTQNTRNAATSGTNGNFVDFVYGPRHLETTNGWAEEGEI